VLGHRSPPASPCALPRSAVELGTRSESGGWPTGRQQREREHGAPEKQPRRAAHRDELTALVVVEGRIETRSMSSTIFHRAALFQKEQPTSVDVRLLIKDQGLQRRQFNSNRPDWRSVAKKQYDVGHIDCEQTQKNSSRLLSTKLQAEE